MRYLFILAATSALMLSAAGCHHKKHSKTPEPIVEPAAVPVEPAPVEPEGPIQGPMP